MFNVSPLFGFASDIMIELKPAELVLDMSNTDELIIYNKRTKNQWTLSSQEFNILYEAYSNWRVVEQKDPIISDITEDDNYVYIHFGYYKDNPKSSFSFFRSNKNSVLAGKILIHKKYLIDKETAQNTKYKYLFFGSGIYSTLVTILLIIVIL